MAKREGGRGDPRQRERRAIFPATTIALSLCPSAALAEVCDKLRPNWVPGTKASALSEALYLFSSLPALVLLLLSALAVIKRSQWGGLATVVLWSGLVSLIALVKDPFFGGAAQAEGCIGSPALFITAVAAICIAIILYTLPRETRL